MKPFILMISLVLSISASYLDKASKELEQGNADKAIQLYRKAALNGENPVLSYFNMGNAYFQLDSVPQSIIYYQAAVNYAPDFFRGWLNLATAYYKLEDMGEAIASVRRALLLDSENPQALFILGTAYRHTQAHAEAIITYEKLLSFHDDYAEAYIAMGELYSDLEDYDMALKWLGRYPEDGSEEGYVHILKAEIAGKTNDDSRELYYLREAFEANSENRWILFRIVESLIRQKNNLVALEEVERGIELFPKFGELAVLGANVAFEMEQLDLAEKYYTLARNNGNPNAVIGLENVRIMRMSKVDS